MATAPPTPSAIKTVGYDDFVDSRIAKTRAAVKSADLATGITTLLAWGLGLLLVAAIADHWLVGGGFDRWERFAVFVVGLAGMGLYAVTRLGPVLRGRVNPLYAAREIERESPDLKNSLLNLLQLRSDRGAAAVRATLERQAAERLADAGEAPIDHTPLVRVARLLLAIVAIIGIYVVASPKDFFASAGRVLAPWAEIAAPSRVRIDDVAPGAVELAQGGRLDASARVTGLEEGELVELVYSTADGRAIDRRVPMRAGTAGKQYTASLPQGSGSSAALGLQGNLTYRIEAGDAHTPTYRVEVLAAPTIVPTKIRYDYPAYTGYSPREVEGVGDLRANEGTRVTITAKSNLPIDSAQVDLGSDGRPDARMRVERATATGLLTLRRDSATNYVLRFTSEDGQTNNNPPQYRIEVIADLAPEVDIRQPEEAVLNVAMNEQVRLTCEARDPDFALSEVQLIGEVGGRRVLERGLLRGDGRGLVRVETGVTPESLGLRPRDVMTYWFTATDNRTPQPNTGVSDRQQLRVTGPAERGSGDPERGDGQPEEGNDPNAQSQPGNPDERRPQPDDQSGGDSSPAEQQPPKQGSEKGPDPNGEQRPNEQQPDESGEQSEEGNSPPPGGLTGAGGEGGDGQADDNGSGAEGPDPAESNEGASPPGGSNESNQGDSTGQPQGDEQGGGNPGESGGQEETTPVPNNGTDDGSAFDRIREFLEGSPSSNAKPSQRQDGRDPSDLPEGRTTEDDARGDDSESPPNGDSPSASSDSAAETPGSKAEGTSAEGEDRSGSDNGMSEPRDGAPGEQPERPEEGPGPGDQDRSGQQSDSTSSDTGGEAPPGESTDPRAGPRQGAEGAGQSEAADQGAGQSADQGAGDSTGRPGKQQQADSPTGEPGGDQTSDGGTKRENPNGNRSGQPPSNSEPGDRNTNENAGRPRESAADGQKGASGQAPNGEASEDSNQITDRRGEGADKAPGGRPNDLNGPQGLVDRGPTSDTSGQGAESGGDAANLDYAREQTDLVLEQLEKQLREREVDRHLLDKLGWTEQDLRRFVDRWRSRQQKASQRGAEGEAELDRALRSLGLGQSGPSKTRAITEDQLRDLRQGARTKTPARWRAAQERYNRSLNASDDATKD